jgi:hypothetical protein
MLPVKQQGNYTYSHVHYMDLEPSEAGGQNQAKKNGLVEGA